MWKFNLEVKKESHIFIIFLPEFLPEITTGQSKFSIPYFTISENESPIILKCTTLPRIAHDHARCMDVFLDDLHDRKGTMISLREWLLPNRNPLEITGNGKQSKRS